MLDKLFKHIAPHLCMSCGKIGSLLCSGCEYNIASQAFTHCLLCRGPVTEPSSCKNCRLPYSKAWCVGWRQGVLEGLIDSFKFERAYEAHQTLAKLLLDRLDQLPAETIIVPIPTIAKHIRQRGYDHALLVARRVAKIRKLKLQSVIKRSSQSQQLRAGRDKRLQQAKTAFQVNQTLDPTRPYLIIDDVVTTGATIQSAAAALRAAGAEIVWVAVLARQPLD